jgi:hypothetical protein
MLNCEATNGQTSPETITTTTSKDEAASRATLKGGRSSLLMEGLDPGLRSLSWLGNSNRIALLSLEISSRDEGPPVCARQPLLNFAAKNALV